MKYLKKFNESNGHAYVNIDYDDGDASTYRAVEVHVDDEIYRFDSGDASVDFIDASKKISDLDISAVYSSSVDHFTMDGSEYKWATLSGKWSQIVPNHINTLEEMQAHYKAAKQPFYLFIGHGSSNGVIKFVKKGDDWTFDIEDKCPPDMDIILGIRQTAFPSTLTPEQIEKELDQDFEYCQIIGEDEIENYC